MAIQLTESAARHVKSMLTHREGAIGLRLGTRKSGCTGFAYVVDYAQQVGEDDTLFESQGIKIVVDVESLPMLDGMTVDYVKANVLNEGFDFINPNIKDQCGCGESFSV
ncbi:MAG: iron-sulfur cluster assembly protein IscA [gamma proteobacterium symbiont of Ctena orbiculata]|uniref:Iron-sulfur cluster assembly accessory protein n=1 Tax=Candidatus Thiodiazotropha taylori TaxID=2792791 RepID=A0A944M6S8_9GAMM|nr:iron-sulfur cluster assembly accessory protein [Candidatus Thiodiazotropha taylori]PUB87648.1 MAG: iron-sulfur cluster assembly protein IscA [gamma proteobacterium symbiont of Ctena orbiculata]MBT2989036.1 iron-sulfur cluster assembly accessory protein [Candidatus Thiodiazotropha taylori]MBT2996318.1 iron-sulfur cluster assembly accessory protein [Candidatus Thiodiazotropha taylori]MBT3000248.1 iron-sulfur cluster assembly accessory protein [Candidatus Thiodiazotropha taylori]